ncbi:phenoloxidase 3-like [Palaemon carinicauda]|uniref:Prophenoloxidase n=1 Tax=Palaemon carinicauda TaxID=392227 RepID=M4I110_PALCI|nr:prophenoloxidase [Palaemon carinicauda]
MASEQIQILELFQHPFREGGGGGGTGITFPSDGGVATRVGLGDRTPDLGYATTIPRGRVFSPFFKGHRRAAKSLCDYFNRARNANELVRLAKGCQNLVNEQLYIYALSFVIIRKPEMRRLRIPTVIETFPNKFASQEMLQQAQNETLRNPTRTEPIIINQEFSGTLLKAEHRVSYWREDYGINVHHWHWHLVFPIELDVNRDRKGEIFFYMHQQMLARYDMERLSVGLNRVIPLNSLREPIPDGYFSKMTINNSGRAWGTRQDNTMLRDIRRDDFGLGFINLSEMEIYYSRILDAVHQGYMMDRQGNRVPLSDDPPNNGKRGIDLLGDAFEADVQLSVNHPFYGDFHNLGHVVLGFSHDPDGSHREEIGAIGDPATSMRDPVFYRFHKFVDDLFEKYKLLQRPYSNEELGVPGVRVTRVGVIQEGVPNNLKTGWSQRDFEAGRGLDFGSTAPVLLRLTHLDHKRFDYHLQIVNSLSAEKEVTVRIFLAPTLDERGNRMNFMDQRLLWAEMDKFVTKLTPGENNLVRSSLDSSITGPEEATFRELEAGREIELGSQDAIEFGQCGCGWPQHMLLPRGMPQGMDYQLFVILSDYARDRVEQVIRNRACNNGVSYCGILDSKFPDARPMGFPFDRRNPEQINGNVIQTAEEFAAQFDNMLMEDIKITFVGNNL